MLSFHQYLTEASKTSWNSVGGIRTIIGQVTIGGRERLQVKTGSSGLAELIAPDEIEQEIRRDESRYASRQAAEQQNARDEEKLKQSMSLDGFEQTLSPMMRGKAQTALLKQVRSDGKFYTIRDLIKLKVSLGYRVSNGRLASPEGVFLTQQQLTKLGLDYAEYLSKKR